MVDCSTHVDESLSAKILDAAPDAVIAIDEARRIVVFNQCAERTFGYRAGDAIGQPLALLIPQGIAGIEATLHALGSDGEQGYRSAGHPASIKGRRSDGVEFPAEVNLSKFSESGNTLFVAIVRDASERIAAEEALRTWQHVFEHAPWGIAVTDAKTTSFTAMNQALAEMHGYTVEELIGRSLNDICALEEGDHLPELDDTSCGTSTISYESVNCCKDGTRFPVVVDVTFVNDMVGAPIFRIVNVRDITARKRVEEALQESEERYRTIVSAMEEGIVLHDADGRIISCNESAERILGLTHDQMLGLTSFDPRWRAINEDGTPAPGERHPATLARLTGQPLSNVVLGVHKADGTQVWTSVNSRPLVRPGETKPHMVITSFADITERKRAELAVKEQEALLRRVLELMPVGVWIIDEEGRIIFGNEAGQQIWAGARYVGIEQFGEYKAWRVDTGELLTPETWAAARAIRNGEITLNEILRIECFDGTQKIIYNSAIPINLPDQDVTGAISINQDITERVEAYRLMEQRVEERTRELSALLEVSRKVASNLELEILLNTILDQLRTVLEYDGAGIAIQQDGGLRLVEYQGIAPRDAMLRYTILSDIDTGYNRVLTRREPVIVENIWENTPWLTRQRGLLEPEVLQALGSIHSWLGVPLIVKDKVIGVLRVDHRQPGYFTQEHAKLAVAFADQAAVAIENARLYEQAQQLAAMEERQRLARELHDSVSQSLYGIVLGTRTARAMLDKEPEKVQEALQYVLSLAETSFAEMRALIFELRPDSIATDGLIAALTRRVDFLRARHKLQVQAEFQQEPDVSVQAKEALYRIAQEALNNVTKHAGATRATLLLQSDVSGVTLQIGDNGRGFDTDDIPAGHFGLKTMTERAESQGGTLEIYSVAGQGTRVTARIPFSLADEWHKERGRSLH